MVNISSNSGLSGKKTVELVEIARTTSNDEFLAELSTHSNQLVRAALVDNPSTPDAIFERLRGDESVHVRKAVQRVLSSRHVSRTQEEIRKDLSKS